MQTDLLSRLLRDFLLLSFVLKNSAFLINCVGECVQIENETILRELLHFGELMLFDAGAYLILVNNSEQAG